MIIAISGTTATGKSSVARLLAKKLNFKLVDLEELAFRKKCIIGYDKKRDSHIVSISRLKNEVKKLKKRYKNLIIEGLLAHLFKADFVIVLRCKPEVLRKRLSKKYSLETKIKENVEAEEIGIITQEAFNYNKNIFEIDTTSKKPRQVVRCIKEILAGKGENYKPGKIEWLA